jgi:hypothetical protein
MVIEPSGATAVVASGRHPVPLHRAGLGRQVRQAPGTHAIPAIRVLAGTAISWPLGPPASRCPVHRVGDLGSGGYLRHGDH